MMEEPSRRGGTRSTMSGVRPSVKRSTDVMSTPDLYKGRPRPASQRGRRQPRIRHKHVEAPAAENGGGIFTRLPDTEPGTAVGINLNVQRQLAYTYIFSSASILGRAQKPLRDIPPW